MSFFLKKKKESQKPEEKSKFKKLVLIILDGFGVTVEKAGNPLALANIPNLKEIERRYPFTVLQASGVAVGLPWGEAGNSEVGHLTIGSGRIIYHHLPRIIYSIYDGSFFKNTALIEAIEHVKFNNSRLHLAGLVSSGSVHSYIDHLYALLELTKKENVKEVYVHCFTDGKDALPKEGGKFLGMLEERIKAEWPHARIVSVVGRYYAMDRDGHWDRTQKAYELITEGKGRSIYSIPEYLYSSYEQSITDEFIEPATVREPGITNYEPSVRDYDSVIFFNFREDSMRQLAHAFADGHFPHFPRKKIENLFIAAMTQYEKSLPVSVAFPPIDAGIPFSGVLGDAGLKHLHVAETNKYAHVTFFFNGGREEPFPGEDRILIPSSTAAHFDEVPEMRAKEITETILEKLGEFDVIIANFANADLIGHSGNLEAGIKTVEVLDESLGKIMEEVLKIDGVMLVTADHGNIELKRDLISGEKRTKHSTNPVPLFVISKAFERKNSRTEEEVIRAKTKVNGILTDVAPTAIELLGLKKPESMTGTSLLKILLNE